VYKDIKNALKVLNPNGMIVCHDMIPMTREAQDVDFDDEGNVLSRKDVIWNGDCWKAFVKLRAEEESLAMATVNSDHGLGVVTKGKQSLIELSMEGSEIDNMDWADFVKNRDEWMNVISVETFYTFCDGIQLAEERKNKTKS
jgi:hypothetical protein